MSHGILGGEARERADRAEQRLDLEATIAGETLGEELDERADGEPSGDALVGFPGPSSSGGLGLGARFGFQLGFRS
jgi:hypothetical protein